ncbi:hypothetical protein HDU93_003845, partial [Gonapodya sp. JEL0774]
ATLFYHVSVPGTATVSHLLTFALFPAVSYSDLRIPTFKPDGEVTELVVLTGMPSKGEMAYEKHEEALRKWFDQNKSIVSPTAPTTSKA